MKLYFFLSAFIIVGSCAETKYSTKIENLKNKITIVDSALVKKYAATITTEELKRNLILFASNDFEGRGTGEIGQKKAVHFLKSFYQNEGIKSNIESVWWR